MLSYLPNFNIINGIPVDYMGTHVRLQLEKVYTKSLMNM